MTYKQRCISKHICVTAVCLFLKKKKIENITKSSQDSNHPNHGEQSNRTPYFSERVTNCLQDTNTVEIHLQLQQALDYQTLSIDQQKCIDEFLSCQRDLKHLPLNHQRLDIGAWICMLQLPLHPQFIQIVRNVRQQLPHLLAHEEDRDRLEKIAHLHRYTKHQDKDGYMRYILQLPFEEQSCTVQTYKKMIIASLSHPNGKSAYFPNLPTTKTIDEYDLNGLYDNDYEQRFPGYKKYLSSLLDKSDNIPLFSSTLEQLFHDILLISSISQYITNQNNLDSFLDLRSDPIVGVITPSVYTSGAFFHPERREPPKEPAPLPHSAKDIYLTNTYTTIENMRKTAQLICENRSLIHSEHESWCECDDYDKYYGNFIQISEKNIIKYNALISKLHGRIDIHYFMRQITTNHSHNPTKKIDTTSHKQNDVFKSSSFILERDSVLYSSEGEYALISAAIIGSYLQRENNISFLINKYIGLNYNDKKVFRTLEDIIPNPAAIIILLYMTHLLPANCLHITHSTVLKRINDSYGFETKDLPDNGMSYLLPIYAGSYQEEGKCCTPEVWIETLEKCRLLIHDHAYTRGYHLTSYLTAFDPHGSQQGSTNDFCYRIVDYLRFVALQDIETYEQLYMNLLHAASTTRTLPLFFTAQYESIQGEQPTDALDG